MDLVAQCLLTGGRVENLDLRPSPVFACLDVDDSHGGAEYNSVVWPHSNVFGQSVRKCLGQDQKSNQFFWFWMIFRISGNFSMIALANFTFLSSIRLTVVNLCCSSFSSVLM